MAYFPFYIDIENKKILVVGGGTAEFFSFAMRKIFLSTQLTIRKNADLFFLQLQAKTA